MADEDGRSPTVLKARWIVPVATGPIEGGALEVADGRIAQVGTAAEVARNARSGGRTVDFGEAVILPGFVNAHSHLELTALRGLFEGLPFPDWIRRVTQVKAQVLSPKELAVSARWGVLEGLRSGITCWGDTCDSGAAVEALLCEGARGICFQETFGPHPDEAEKSLRVLQEKVAELRRQVVLHLKTVSRGDLSDLPPGPLELDGARVQIGISPHAPYTVSGTLYRDCTDYALQEGLPMAAHVAESEDEERLLSDGTGAFGRRFAERGIPFRPPGVSPIRYLDQLGVLRARPLLIHCVRADREDLARAREAKATVAHCPQSNAKLGAGVAPLPAMLEMGLAVGLGTDGAVSNNAHDMFQEMKFCSLVHRASDRSAEALPPAQVLSMATLGAARALGLDGKLGSLEPGKYADLAVVDLGQPSVQPVTDPVTTVVYSSSARDVAATFVGGRRIYADFSRVAPAYAEIGRKLRAATEAAAAGAAPR